MINRLLERIRVRVTEAGSIRGVVRMDLGAGGTWILDGTTGSISGDAPELAVDCTLSMSEADLRRIVDHEIDPRFAVMQRRVSISGAPEIGINLLTLLGQERDEAVPVDTGGILPVPTTDLVQARADLEMFGYCLVKDALSPEELAALRTRLVEQAQGEREIGRAYLDGADEPGQGPNQRVWFLVNKGQEFRDLLEHPLIDDFVVPLVGEDLIVFSFCANIAGPGGKPMVLHTDQSYIQPPIKFMVGVNVAWYLDDVTEENGGTRVIPGSHRGGRDPVDPRSLDGTIAAAAPAGTALVFESRLWHGTGPNVGSEKRHVLLSLFVRYFLRQQENPFLAIAPGIEESLSDKVKARLGYRVTTLLGNVEGPVEGALVSRPAAPVTAIRPAKT